APPGVLRCADAARMRLPRCEGTEVISVDRFVYGKVTDVVATGTAPPDSALGGLPLNAVAVFTDGSATTVERVRTRLDLAGPERPALTGADFDRDGRHTLVMVEQLSNAGLGITLVIAGCSLAVAVAGGLVERKRPFALLRLSGMRRRELHGVVVAESAAPLLVTAAVSAVAGQVVAALILLVTGNAVRTTIYAPPSIGYWIALAGGIGLALAVVSATLPLLDRMTSLEAVRFD